MPPTTPYRAGSGQLIASMHVCDFASVLASTRWVRRASRELTRMPGVRFAKVMTCFGTRGSAGFSLYGLPNDVRRCHPDARGWAGEIAGVTLSRAHLVGVPEAIRSREDLAGADRAITYELAATEARSMSAEQWARASWEGAPTTVRWFQTLGWRLVLGLRLARGRTPTHVLGWRMLDDRPDTVTLKARSFLVTAHNVVTVQESTVLWTTLVHYEQPIARPIWRLVELVHRIVLPYTLTHAGKARRHEHGRQDQR
jgi:hypothetical protein